MISSSLSLVPIYARLRDSLSYTAIRKHMECPAFRQALAAPGIQGYGLAALALADSWYGIQGGNLKLENQNSEWQSTKLAQFGINPNSVRFDSSTSTCRHSTASAP